MNHARRWQGANPTEKTDNARNPKTGPWNKTCRSCTQHRALGPLNGYPAPPETSSKVGQASSTGPGESAPSNFTRHPSQRRITEVQRPRAVALSRSPRPPSCRGYSRALFCDLKRSSAALLPPSNPCLGIPDCSNPGPMMPSRKPAPPSTRSDGSKPSQVPNAETVWVRLAMTPSSRSVAKIDPKTVNAGR